mmetsp:Transcript_1253/g.2297  ORF Transcript_1253/g.2297 Transcript_1253/m.2297 type:complete len:235 (+) Transcript_1253:1193-1897(+)
MIRPPRPNLARTGIPSGTGPDGRTKLKFLGYLSVRDVFSCAVFRVDAAANTLWSNGETPFAAKPPAKYRTCFKNRLPESSNPSVSAPDAHFFFDKPLSPSFRECNLRFFLVPSKLLSSFGAISDSSAFFLCHARVARSKSFLMRSRFDCCSNSVRARSKSLRRVTAFLKLSYVLLRARSLFPELSCSRGLNATAGLISWGSGGRWKSRRKLHFRFRRRSAQCSYIDFLPSSPAK